MRLIDRIAGALKWVALLIGVVFGWKQYRKITKGGCSVGSVQEGDSWVPLGGSENKIFVTDAMGQGEVVELPDGVKMKDVKAVKVTAKGEAVVEVVHDVRDRRGYSGSGSGNRAE